MLFGLLHAVFLFVGDILGLYALLGFVLMFFIRASDKLLIRWAFILPLFPIAQHLIMVYINYQNGGSESTSGTSQMFEMIFDTYKNGSFTEGLPISFFGYIFGRFGDILFTGRAFRVFSLFLLGLWEYRKGLFTQVNQYKSLLKTVMIIAFSIGIPLNVIYAIIINDPAYYNLEWKGMINPLVYAYGVPFLGMAYAAGLTLLYQKEQWKKVLKVFAPVGRMALTVYISQSLFMSFFFHGWGLGYFGELNAAAYIPLGLGLYFLQVIMSHIWLRYFKFGPLEWIWRSLTYMKIQKMKY